MSVKQVMRYLRRSRSGLTSISDKLKPIPVTNPKAERFYWKDEVIKFKLANPVDAAKQRAGRKSRRTKTDSFVDLTAAILDNDGFYSALDSLTDRDKKSANLTNKGNKVNANK